MSRKGVIPPQFLAHPPRSWKGDMPKIKREARADKRKPSKGARMPRKYRTRRRSGKRDFHLVPDLAAVAAAGELLVPAIQGVLSNGFDLQNLPNAIADGYKGGNWKYNAKVAAELGAAAVITKVVANKFGFNRIKLMKKVNLF